MSSRLTFRLIALCAAAAAAVSLASLPNAQAAAGKPHAGSVFGWYPVASRHEFRGPVPSAFKKSGKGKHLTRNGMLTLIANQQARINSTWTLSARTGRWEARFRTDQITRSGSADYTLQISLIPTTSAAQHCGGQGISLLRYHPSKPKTAHLEINTLPKHRHTKTVRSDRTIGDDQWHTIAAEVRPNRISFYLDARVVAKETRPTALLDVPLKLQFSLIPAPNRRTRSTRLSVDWARYWTLRKAGTNQAKVRNAPPMAYSTNPNAC